jgi:hypothetical protein
MVGLSNRVIDGVRMVARVCSGEEIESGGPQYKVSVRCVNSARTAVLIFEPVGAFLQNQQRGRARTWVFCPLWAVAG